MSEGTSLLAVFIVIGIAISFLAHLLILIKNRLSDMMEEPYSHGWTYDGKEH